MTVATELFRFDDSFARELEGMYDPWHAAPAPEPHLVLLNRELAAELGVDADALATSDGLQVLVGNDVVPGSRRSRWPTPATSSAATRPGWATAGRCCSAR
jgi:uncharacterized protein YdiU (UPF0061 family)